MYIRIISFFSSIPVVLLFIKFLSFFHSSNFAITLRSFSVYFLFFIFFYCLLSFFSKNKRKCLYILILVFIVFGFSEVERLKRINLHKSVFSKHVFIETLNKGEYKKTFVQTLLGVGVDQYVFQSDKFIPSSQKSVFQLLLNDILCPTPNLSSFSLFSVFLLENGVLFVLFLSLYIFYLAYKFYQDFFVYKKLKFFTIISLFFLFIISTFYLNYFYFQSWLFVFLFIFLFFLVYLSYRKEKLIFSYNVFDKIDSELLKKGFSFSIFLLLFLFFFLSIIFYNLKIESELFDTLPMYREQLKLIKKIDHKKLTLKKMLPWSYQIKKMSTIRFPMLVYSASDRRKRLAFSFMMIGWYDAAAFSLVKQQIVEPLNLKLKYLCYEIFYFNNDYLQSLNTLKKILTLSSQNLWVYERLVFFYKNKFKNEELALGYLRQFLKLKSLRNGE